MGLCCLLFPNGDVNAYSLVNAFTKVQDDGTSLVGALCFSDTCNAEFFFFSVCNYFCFAFSGSRVTLTRMSETAHFHDGLVTVSFTKRCEFIAR